MWPFDANNQQMYQQYANAWDQGTYSMSPQEAARLTTYAQPYLPGMLQQVMANPAAKTAVAGLVSYAAKQMLGNRGGIPGSL